MAVVPSSGTNIRFLSGIKFQNDYKHTRWFDTLSDQLNWWANQTTVYSRSEFNIQRVEDKTFIRMNLDISQLWGVNYVVFYNEYHGRQFYAFVTKLEYVQKNRTDVHIELDVLQTWMFDINWKPSFVVREHCQLWNADGTPVINTVPEDLNYGSEYDTVQVQNILPLNGYKFLVAIAKSTIHAQDGTTGIGVSFPAKSMIPTVIGTPQPLSVYILPFRDNDEVPGVTLSQGGSPQLSTPSSFLRGLYLTDSAIDNIVSLYVTDWCGIDVSENNGMLTFANNNNEIIPASFTGTDPTTQQSETYHCLYVQSVWSFATRDFYLGGLYLGFKNVTESKLLMHPYTKITLDDFKGNRVDYKPEYVNDSTLYVSLKGSLGLSNKTSYGIQAYNSKTDTNKLQISDEFALINTDPSDVPVINSNLGAFLQGHKNTINNQKASLLYNYKMDTIGTSIGALASASRGNVVGTATGMTNIIKGGGNLNLQMQGFLAQQEDIANVPPQISKMGSNTSYTVGNGYNGVFVIKKHLKDEYLNKLQNYFGMFGYKKNEVKFPNIHTRQYWNFVQTSGCIIQGNFNNEDLEDIKSIFDGGITLWHTDDIGNYTLTNGVIANG